MGIVIFVQFDVKHAFFLLINESRECSLGIRVMLYTVWLHWSTQLYIFFVFEKTKRRTERQGILGFANEKIAAVECQEPFSLYK